MASVHDVASQVVDSYESSISTMKLQKLVYLAQGWSLALRDKPLFDGQFEAWANGPVNRDLFREHRTQYSVSRWRRGDPARLTKNERLVIDAVIRKYGALSGGELSDLTHVVGTPWSRARKRAGVSDGASSTEPLSIDEMKAHFKKLASGMSRRA